MSPFDTAIPQIKSGVDRTWTEYSCVSETIKSTAQFVAFAGSSKVSEMNALPALETARNDLKSASVEATNRN